MKAKLEAIANVTVIVVALAVGFVVLKGRVAGPRITRSLTVGDRQAQVPGIDWSQQQTVDQMHRLEESWRATIKEKNVR